jgi:O-antigen/teichoic acid export membrane protein
VVTPGFLVGAGRAREVARIMVCVAAANLVLSLALTPELGLEGPAIGTALPFVVAFPFLLRLGLAASGAPLRDLAARAWFPNYALAAILAALLLAGRELLPMDETAAVMGVVAAGLLLYWGAFYGLVLAADERELARGLVSRRARAR